MMIIVYNLQVFFNSSSSDNHDDDYDYDYDERQQRWYDTILIHSILINKVIFLFKKYAPLKKISHFFLINLIYILYVYLLNIDSFSLSLSLSHIVGFLFDEEVRIFNQYICAVVQCSIFYWYVLLCEPIYIYIMIDKLSLLLFCCCVSIYWNLFFYIFFSNSAQTHIFIFIDIIIINWLKNKQKQ